MSEIIKSKADYAAIYDAEYYSGKKSFFYKFSGGYRDYRSYFDRLAQWFAPYMRSGVLLEAMRRAGAQPACASVRLWVAVLCHVQAHDRVPVVQGRQGRRAVAGHRQGSVVQGAQAQGCRICPPRHPAQAMRPVWR